MQKKHLTREQALQKLRQYCAYQERCHYEVEQKLWNLGINKKEHGAIIATLIEDDYLNEERYAIQYAGGKFRMNDWGRKKIYYSLKEKKISEYCIKKALKQIDNSDYEKTINALAVKKYAQLKEEQPLIRRKKTMDYLLLKGYEPELINRIVSQLGHKEAQDDRKS